MKNDMRRSDTAVMLRVENNNMMIKKPEIRKIPIPGDLKRSRIPGMSKLRGSESCANIKFLRYLPKNISRFLEFRDGAVGIFSGFLNLDPDSWNFCPLSAGFSGKIPKPKSGISENSFFNSSTVDILLPNAPWGYSVEFFNKHKIDFIAHDEAPYNIGGQDGNFLKVIRKK